MTRPLLFPAWLAACLLLLAAAGCAGPKGPSVEYLNRIDAMNAVQLQDELGALRSERAFLREREQELQSAETDGAKLRKEHIRILLAGTDARLSEVQRKLTELDIPPEQEVRAPSPKQPLPPAAAPERLHIDRQVETPPSELVRHDLKDNTLRPTLAGIEWQAKATSLDVSIITTADAPDVRVFTLSNPPRIIADISGMTEPTPPAGRIEVATSKILCIRMGWHPSRSVIRVVIDVAGPTIPQFSSHPQPNGVVISLK